MKRSSFLLLSVLLTACSGHFFQQEKLSEPSVTEEQSVAKPLTTASYMTNQENEFKKAVGDAPFKIIRENNILALILFGKDIFSSPDQRPVPAVENALKKIANILSRYDKTHISIIGYADNGDPSADGPISEKRAEAVANVLKQSAEIADVRFWIEGSTPYSDDPPVSDDPRSIAFQFF